MSGLERIDDDALVISSRLAYRIYCNGTWLDLEENAEQLLANVCRDVGPEIFVTTPTPPVQRGFVAIAHDQYRCRYIRHILPRRALSD